MYFISNNLDLFYEDFLIENIKFPEKQDSVVFFVIKK